MNTNNYQIYFPSSVYSGAQSLNRLPDLLVGQKKAVILTNKVIVDNHGLDYAISKLQDQGTEYVIIDNVAIEPLASQVQEIVNICKNIECETIIAVGGGSVMDTAKIVSLLCETDLTVFDLLENPLAVSKRNKYLILIPTTAGTGAEVTPNAIVTDAARQLKIGIVNPAIIPDCVILDPELIRTLPPAITASTGMDALCHAIECYISKKSNQLSDTLAIDAMRLIFKYLPKSYTDPDNMDARANMLYASFLAGLCIATSSTVAVHALSYPLGGHYHIPHGTSNAMLLCEVMKYNLPAVREKFQQIAIRCLDSDPNISLEESSQLVVDRIDQMTKFLSIPTDLKKYGIHPEILDELAVEAYGIRRLLDNNPREMNIEDIKNIYRKLM